MATYHPQDPTVRGGQIRFKVNQTNNINDYTTTVSITLQMKDQWVGKHYHLGTIRISSGSTTLKTWTPADYSRSTANTWVDVDTITLTLSRTTYSSIVITPVKPDNLGDFAYYYYGNSYNYIYYVDGAQTVSLISIAARYKLTTSIGSNTSVTVNRTSSAAGAATGKITNGAYIYAGDILKVTYALSTGYKIGTHTINGTTFTSGDSHTVSSAVTVKTTASVISYTLSVTAGVGSSITVYRSASPIKGAASGYLSNGDTVYYNDVLKGQYTLTTGYKADSTTATIGWNTAASVTKTPKFAVVTSVLKYLLSISGDDNTHVTVNRTSSPLQSASIGEITDGDYIYYNDVLTIVYTPTDGYGFKVATLNGGEIVSPHTVIAAVALVFKTEPKASIHVWNGSGWDTYLIYVSDGSAWSLHQAHISNGSQWEKYY